jgi:hypothetical protein
MKLLVVTSLALPDDELRAGLERAGVPDLTGAEVKVLAPAVHASAIRYWVSDADEAIEHADAVSERTAAQLDRPDTDVEGLTGESDPLLAIEDALSDFAADRIVIFSHDPLSGRARYREDVDPELIADRVGIPVEHVVEPD